MVHVAPLTSLWAESVAGVAVIVVGGGTPAVAVIAARRGTLVVFVPLKREGELAGGAVSVPAQREQHWNNKLRERAGCSSWEDGMASVIYIHLKMYILCGSVRVGTGQK